MKNLEELKRYLLLNLKCLMNKLTLFKKQTQPLQNHEIIFYTQKPSA